VGAIAELRQRGAKKAELRQRGAKKIVVAGASLGGAAVLAAAASSPPALAGVVSISGPDSAFLRGGGYDYAVLDRPLPHAASGAPCCSSLRRTTRPFRPRRRARSTGLPPPRTSG